MSGWGSGCYCRQGTAYATAYPLTRVTQHNNSGCGSTNTTPAAARRPTATNSAPQAGERRRRAPPDHGDGQPCRHAARARTAAAIAARAAAGVAGLRRDVQPVEQQAHLRRNPRAARDVRRAVRRHGARRRRPAARAAPSPLSACSPALSDRPRAAAQTKPAPESATAERVAIAAIEAAQMAAHDHNAVVDISVRRRVELSANNVDYVANYTLNYTTTSSDRGPTNMTNDKEPTTVRAVALFVFLSGSSALTLWAARRIARRWRRRRASSGTRPRCRPASRPRRSRRASRRARRARCGAALDVRDGPPEFTRCDKKFLHILVPFLTPTQDSSCWTSLGVTGQLSPRALNRHARALRPAATETRSGRTGRRSENG